MVEWDKLLTHLIQASERTVLRMRFCKGIYYSSHQGEAKTSFESCWTVPYESEFKSSAVLSTRNLSDAYCTSDERSKHLLGYAWIFHSLNGCNLAPPTAYQFDGLTITGNLHYLIVVRHHRWPTIIKKPLWNSLLLDHVIFPCLVFLNCFNSVIADNMIT